MRSPIYHLYPISKCITLATLALTLLLALVPPAALAADTFEPYFNRRVQELDDDNFREVTSRPNTVTIVTFYSRMGCTQCREVRDIVNRAAQDLYGQVSFASVDIKNPEAEKTTTALKLTSVAQVPAIRIFPSSARFAELEANGFKLSSEAPMDTGDELPIKFPLALNDFKASAMKPVQERADVAVIDGKDIIKFLRGEPLTAASKTGPLSKLDRRRIPKVVLVSTKKEVPAVWQAMGLAFREKVRVGFVQKSDRAAMRKLPENTQAPAIYIFPAPGMDSKQKGDEIDPILFSGTFKANFIRSFIAPHALDLAAELNDPSIAITQEDLGIPRLDDDTCLDANCRALGGLCAILVTPWDQSQRDTTAQLATLAAVQDSRPDTFVHFSYMIDKNEPKFLKQLGLNPEPYAQLVLLDPRQKKFSQFIGSFQADDIARWISNVINGAHAVRSITPPPGINPSEDPKSWQLKLETEGSKCAGMADRVRLKEERRAAAIRAEQARAEAERKARNATESFEATIAPGNEDEKWVKHIRPQGRPGTVTQVDDRNFERNVVNRNTPVLVRFTNDPHESSPEADAFRAAGVALNGMIKFSSVLCPGAPRPAGSTPESTSDRVVRTYLGPKTSAPCGGQILVFPSQTSLNLKSTPDNKLARDRDYFLYDGQITKDALMKFSLDLVKDGSVRVLTQATFQKWLLENLLMPRLVIVSDKREPSQLARALALEFEGYVDVGMVHSTEHELLQQLQVDRVPAVRILKNKLVPKPGKADTMELGVEMIKFVDAALYFNAIAQMLDDVATVRFVTGPPPSKPADLDQFPPFNRTGSEYDSDTATNPAHFEQPKLTEEQRAELEKMAKKVIEEREKASGKGSEKTGTTLKEEL